MSHSPARASVSILFDGSRCFRARHQDHGASAPMSRAKRGEPDTRVAHFALYEAVRRAKLTKRVTSHTFRNSFATHLMLANYDIRAIQTLLGHSDVRTTMICTHCVPSKTIKELKSPLDF